MFVKTKKHLDKLSLNRKHSYFNKSFEKYFNQNNNC